MGTLEITDKSLSNSILDILPRPVVCLDSDNKLVYLNTAAETFFEIGRALIIKHALSDLVDFDSPIMDLISLVRKTSSPIYEHQVEIRSPRLNTSVATDIFVDVIDDHGADIVMMLQPRTIADKIDRHFHHRGAARSVMSMASILAHEIKNPLFGIRGAAQLLEDSVSSEDKALTYMIKDEADRIVGLVDRMQVFNDQKPLKQDAVNIYAVLNRVVNSAKLGFGAHVTFKEIYDPSLPDMVGDMDQLIQVFMNLIKNASEAIDDNREDGQIEVITAFRPGIKFLMPASNERVSLPLEITIKDNGSGFSEAIKETLFDPFMTTKQNGTGLGLALVAKIIDDHGGIIECQRDDNYTKFSVLMPMYKNK